MKTERLVYRHATRQTRRFVIYYGYIIISLAVCACNKPKEVPTAFKASAGQSLEKTSINNVHHQPANATVMDALHTLKDGPATYDNADQKANAVKILGDNKAVEAVPLLINGLMTIHPHRVFNTDLDKYYPVAPALVQIGDPATIQLERRFEETSDEREELMLLMILHRIKGKVWVAEYLNRIEVEQVASHKNIDRYKHWISGYQD